MTCHGCSGKGWIETGSGVYVHICPVCRGTGWLPDATATQTAVPYKIPNTTERYAQFAEALELYKKYGRILV